jgi:hypothetical protein
MSANHLAFKIVATVSCCALGVLQILDASRQRKITLLFAFTMIAWGITMAWILMISN